MPQVKSFWDHPIEKLEEALSIRKQIAQLEEVLKEMFGPTPTPSAANQTKRVGEPTMSAEARERIAAAQRARWAKSKGTPTVASKTATKSSATTQKKGLTPEGRAKLAAAMKARWAARKKGGSAPNAPTKAAAVVKTPKKAKRNISPEARAKMVEAAKKRWAKATS